MKWTLLGLAGVISGWFAYAVTITPTSATYGKLSVGAVVSRTFKVARSDTLPAIVSLEGPDATEFFIRGPQSSKDRGEADTLYGCWNEALGKSTGTCDVSVDFRPTKLGVKTATLVVTDAHGQKATAALQGEATVPKCRLELVSCNWTISYKGLIHIHAVDSSVTADRVTKYETNLDVSIDQGRVTCQGTRREFEQALMDGKPTDELTFNGSITGSGLAAIEFQRDRNGNMSYILSYACASPAGVRVSKSLRFGTSESEDVKADPPDWRDNRTVGVPVLVSEQGILLLEGTHVSTSWEPANKEGGYIKADWTLRTP